MRMNEDCALRAGACLPINAAQRKLPREPPATIADYLGLVDPAWSVHDVRARFMRLQRESSDATPLYFVAYGESLDRFERVLRRMEGVEDGIVDGC
jgi:hypothetical protein